jgi:hypothetical protein
MQCPLEQDWHNRFIIEGSKHSLKLLSKIGLALKVFLIGCQEPVRNVALPCLIVEARRHRREQRPPT